MRIAVCVKENSFETEVDGRFGRCRYFALVELATGQVDFVPNEAADERGAGVKAARIIIKNKVDAIITDNIGPKAFDLLKRANVRIYGGLTGTLEDTLDLYHNQALKEMAGAKRV